VFTAPLVPEPAAPADVTVEPPLPAPPLASPASGAALLQAITQPINPFAATNRASMTTT
jgi:hypothetical protein